MRRWLVGGTSLVLASALSPPAHAQGAPVIDTASITGRALEHVETIARWSVQLQGMEAQLQQLMAAYRAVTGVRDMGSAMSALNLLGVQNPLPLDPYAIQNIISGSPAGIPAALSGLYTGNRSANRIYTPPDGDWQAQQMNTSANSLAGIQALAQRSYQAAADRLTLLCNLRARAATASDPAEVAQLHAQTAMVQADIASQQAQLQTIAVMAQTQDRVRTQRDDEHERQCMDKLVAYFGGSAADTSCPVPAAANVMSVMATGGISSMTGGAGGSGVLSTMLSQSWGQQAADNATQLGVNPNALAATCVLESGCATNPGGTGTVSGSFQMTDATYQAAMRQAGADPSLLGKLDPATQSIAASQELKTAALTLQQAGVANPSIMDVRGAYNFGQGYGVSLARADSSATMSSVLSSYSLATLQSNGITPGMTVGQWRTSVAGKLGGSANQPVLLGLTST